MDNVDTKINDILETITVFCRDNHIKMLESNEFKSENKVLDFTKDETELSFKISIFDIHYKDPICIITEIKHKLQTTFLDSQYIHWLLWEIYLGGNSNGKRKSTNSN